MTVVLLRVPGGGVMMTRLRQVFATMRAHPRRFSRKSGTDRQSNGEQGEHKSHP
jgi:hypothetical protein